VQNLTRRAECASKSDNKNENGVKKRGCGSRVVVFASIKRHPFHSLKMMEIHVPRQQMNIKNLAVSQFVFCMHFFSAPAVLFF